MSVTLLAVIFGSVFFFQNWFYFKLVGSILDKPRFNSKLPMILCTFINTIGAMALFTVTMPSSIFMYVGIIVLFVIEYLICFKDRALGIGLCVFSITLHIMALRAIITGIFSTSTGLSVYELANSDFYFWVIMILTGACGVIFTIGCIVVIPRRMLRIISQTADQALFMVLLAGLFNVYMILNSLVFSTHIDNPIVALNEIVSATAMLGGLYIGLFMLIRFDKLHGYKEKSEQLELELSEEKVYKHSFLTQANMIVECNITQNRILKVLDRGGDVDISRFKSYSDYIDYHVTDNVVLKDDLEVFLENTSRETLLNAYNSARKEFTFEFRSNSQTGRYEWYKAHVHCENRDGELIVLFTVNNINEEKNRESKLIKKAEIDQLTGVYNKGAIANQVDEKLRENPKGALIMFDLDNFKGINDNLGHAYGDEVLAEVALKVSSLFRGGDVIGRIGGDEFVVFMKDLVFTHAIERKVKEICWTIEKDYVSNAGVIVHVSTSVGIATAPKDGTEYNMLLDCADKAMYYSKSSGKNMYTFYDKEKTEGYLNSN